MFYKISILVICVIFSACGKSPIKTTYNPPAGPQYSPLNILSDSYFNDYIEDFAIQYLRYTGNQYLGNNIPINFHDLTTLPYLSNKAINISNHNFDAANNQTTMAGVCLSYPNGEREILIDENVWERIRSSVGCNAYCFERRRALIFHELGHCLLNRSHKDEVHLNHNLSLMNSILISQADITRWQDSYFKELFTSDDIDLILEIENFVSND